MLSLTWASQPLLELKSTTIVPASTLPTTVNPGCVVLSNGMAPREAAKYLSTSTLTSLRPATRYGAMSIAS